MSISITASSSLSYLYTQKLTGTFPLLEKRSLIRRENLLGIGSAMNGLNKLILFITLTILHSLNYDNDYALIN